MKYFKWVLGHEVVNVKIVKFDHHGTPIEAFGDAEDALKYFIDGSILYKNFFVDLCKDFWKEISESQYNAIKNLYTIPSKKIYINFIEDLGEVKYEMLEKKISNNYNNIKKLYNTTDTFISSYFIKSDHHSTIKNLFTNPSPPTKYYKWYTLGLFMPDTIYYNQELKNLLEFIYAPVMESTTPLDSDLWIEITKSEYDRIRYLARLMQI